MFAGALECNPRERQSFLDAACGGDSELRSEVESLLESDDSSGDFIEQPPPELKFLLPEERHQANEPGKRVGAYELVREIGSGGMGTVYLAVRADAEFQKHVAVKLIRKGMESDLVIDRFRKETQILATLEHPNIARLIDAGATPDGQPYLVMEYVEGVPIDTYCETQKLSIQERVALFRDVCAAVQCAHQSLIVHRDLKPGNVLVTAKRQVKLLDFGIAKLIRGDQDSARAPTKTGLPMMTPEYASPEQVRGEAVTTVSDVYSLGVILYQLLAGRYPYILKSRSVWEIQRIICDEDPVKPSVAVADPCAALAGRGGDGPADDRETPERRPRTISRQLRGDLDNIVLKAISKESSRRYSSAEALSEDLRRYLNGEPVAAHPPTLRYRAAKFVRRYRTVVVAAALLLLSLTGGMIATSRQAHQAQRERERAESSLQRANQERARADNEAATARAVNQFLENDLLAQASASVQARPDTKPDPDLKVRTALDRAATRLAGKFDRQPLVEASIRQTIGDTYTDLGLYSDAEAQVSRALALRHRVLGDLHRDTLTSMHKLAILYWRRAKYGDAEPLFIKVVDTRRRSLGDDHPETLGAMNDLALLYWYQGKYAEAQSLLTKALEIRRRMLGQEHPEVLSSMNNLAGLYVHQGKYSLAEPLFIRVLEVRSRVLGPEHPDTLLSMNNLAIVYWDEGRYLPAEALLTKVLDVKQHVLGPEHPETLITRNNLGGLYRDQGKYSSADPLFSKVLDVRRRVLGPEHPDTLFSMNNLALLYQYQGKYAQAESLLTKTLEVRQRVLGQQHPDTIISMNNLALLYASEGKYEIAEPLFIKTIEAQRRILGPEHPRRLASMNGLAAVYLKQHEYRAAEPLLRDTLSGYQNANLSTWARYRCESLLGASLAAQKQYPEAERLLLSGYEGLMKQKATIPWECQSVLTESAEWIVRLYDGRGRPDKASEWRQKAHLISSAPGQ